MDALAHVYYLQAAGWRRKNAEEKVADAYGVTVSNLRMWERRDLPKIGLGEELKEQKVRAVSAGKKADGDSIAECFDFIRLDGAAYRKVVDSKK